MKPVQTVYGDVSLYDHQTRLVGIAREHKRYGLFFKPGTGKTIAILAVQRDRPKRTLIVATRSIIETAWVPDAELMGVPFVNALGTKAKRQESLTRRSHMMVGTNYDQFRIERRLIAKAGYDRFVFDESSKLKNPKSKTTDAAFTVGYSAEECYLLTGTPAPNSPVEIWSQLYLINKEAAGGSFWKFAHHFFTPDIEWIYVRGKEKKVIKGWEFKSPGHEKAFNEHLAKYSWALRKEDCLDLHKPTNEFIYFDLPREERELYEEVRDDVAMTLAADPSKPISRDNYSWEALKKQGVTMKLRQIPGGTVITQNGPQRVGKAKLNALSGWLDEIGNEKVVIWFEFTEEFEMLKEMLHERGDITAEIRGGTKSVKAEVDKFVKGPANRILCHPQSAGHGTNGLQKACKYAAFYSMSFSSEYHEQARDRLDRSGQEWPVTYGYFIARDTMDESVFSVVMNKTEKQDALLKELTR